MARISLHYALKNNIYNPADGSIIRLVGDEFVPNVSVLANNELMPSVRLIDSYNIDFYLSVLSHLINLKI
jgi:hypothetical protein